MNNKIMLNTENKNLRNACYWYPCHKSVPEDNYDCRSCYCSLYEECSKINNSLFGGYLLKYKDSDGSNKEIFACERCTVLHIKENVDYYLELKEQGFNNKEILDKLIENKL